MNEAQTTMQSELAGVGAFVTGAGSGIGRAVAERLAAAGASVAVVDRDERSATRTAEEISARGGAAVPVRADVRDRGEVEGAFATARAEIGLPRVLVTAAGISSSTGDQDILRMADDEWDAVLDINLRGTFLCCQVAARALVESAESGSLVTISSIGAARPTFGYPAYHASKGGVSAFTRSIAVNLAPKGIRANSIAPGYTITAMTSEGLDDREVFEAVHHRIPLGRMGRASEIAEAALFLGSERSAYVTGHELVVDGGAVALGWTPATIHSDAMAVIREASL